MAQFLRPDSNVTQTSFTGGFAEIDEATASDADFAYGANNTAAVLEVGLSNPAATPDPAGTSTVRYRIAKTNAGTVNGAGNAVAVTPGVYQGATLIQAGTAQTATGTWTQYTFTFTHGTITDWTDVRLRFTTTASGGSPANRRGGAVSWAEVEAPDAAPVILDLDVTVGAFSLVGVDALLQVNRQLVNSTGTFSLAGVNIDFAKQVSLEVDPGTFTLSGTTTGLLFNRRLDKQTGVFTLAGVNTILLNNRRLDTSVAPYSFIGNQLDVNLQRALLSNTGTFSLVGNNSLLQREARIDATTRTYAVDGTNTGLLFNRQLVSQAGTFSIAGVDVTLQYVPVGGILTLDTVVGAFSLSGTSINLNKEYYLNTSQAAYQLSGFDLQTTVNRSLQLAPSTFVTRLQSNGDFFWYRTTQTIQPVKYRITKRNEWILGRATHMGRRGI
jgi:hypothetical protein